MSEVSAKDIRKQIRNVLQENLNTILGQELAQEINKTLAEALNKRLDSIEEYVKKTLKQQDDRAKAVQGFIVQEVKVDIMNRLHNMDVTMQAWQEVMNDKLGDVSELNKAVDAKKLEIHNKIEAEAVAKQQAALQGKSD